MLDSEILFFFSAIGVFNCFLLSTYLLLRPRKPQLRDIFLGIFLLMLSIRVGVSCVYFFEENIDPLLIQIGLSAHFLSAALLFVFLQTIPPLPSKLVRNSIYITIFLLLVVAIGGYIFSFSEYPRFWDNQLRYVLHGLVAIYLVVSALSLKSIWVKILNRQALSLLEKENLIVFVGYLLTCLAFAISLLYSYILGPLLFSIIFYGIGILFYFWRKDTQSPKLKYANRKIKEDKAEALIQALLLAMQKEDFYKNPNLKISDLATYLHISSHQLSQLLNDNLNKRFTNFINEFRIEEAKKLLLKDQHLTVEAIAHEVGFNSKSSFYTAFKQFTQQTPAAYKSAILAGKSSKL